MVDMIVDMIVAVGTLTNAAKGELISMQQEQLTLLGQLRIDPRGEIA